MNDYLGPYLLGPNDTPENGIYTGDARELAKAIPDESVDLIFTDPIYQNIDDYRWLAETAARVLKPGGNLLAQTGKLWLRQVLRAMDEYGLKWQTLIAEVYPRAAGLIGGSRTMSGWKPYIWYSKGERSGQWCFDRLRTSGQDKTKHPWGDSPDFALLYMERLTDSLAVVFDPFTGGGTMPAVCKMLGRRYLAFEILPDVAATARERVRTTQMPLFVLEPEQMTLGGD